MPSTPKVPEVKVTDSAIAEIKSLIESGDVSLDEYRAKFKHQMQRDTALNDDQLIRAIAATDDDDDVLFAANAAAIEQGA